MHTSLLVNGYKIELKILCDLFGSLMIPMHSVKSFCIWKASQRSVWEARLCIWTAGIQAALHHAPVKHSVFIHKAGRMKASSMFVSNEWKKISTYSTSQHLTSSNLWRSWSSYHYHIATNPSPKCYFLTAHCFLRMVEPNKLTCFANAFDQLGYANAQFFIIKRWEIVKKGVRLTTWKGGKENPTLTLSHPYRTVPSRRISEKQKWLRDRFTFCRGILT